MQALFYQPQIWRTGGDSSQVNFKTHFIFCIFALIEQILPAKTGSIGAKRTDKKLHFKLFKQISYISKPFFSNVWLKTFKT